MADTATVETSNRSEEDCETCSPTEGLKEGTTGVVSALMASSCCWIPAVAALLGFSAAGAGSAMMDYHTPMAVLAVGLIGVAWYLFLRRRIAGGVAWRAGAMTWGILVISTTVVLLYSVVGWIFPSVLVVLMG